MSRCEMRREEMAELMLNREMLDVCICIRVHLSSRTDILQTWCFLILRKIKHLETALAMIPLTERINLYATQ